MNYGGSVRFHRDYKSRFSLDVRGRMKRMSAFGVGGAVTVPQRLSPTTPLETISLSEYLSVSPDISSRVERQSKTESGATASSGGCATWGFERFRLQSNL